MGYFNTVMAASADRRRIGPAPTGSPYPGETLSSPTSQQWTIDGTPSGSPGFTFVIPEATAAGALITAGNSLQVTVLAYAGWVATDGNDSNAGTYASPWLTLGRIITYVQGTAVSATLTLTATSGTVTATRSNGTFSAGDVGKSLYEINGNGAGVITAVGTTTCTLQITTAFTSTTATTGQWAIAEMLDGVTSRIRIKAGTYTNQSCNVARTGSAAAKATKLIIKCQSGVNVAWTAGTDQSCWQAGGGNWTMDVSGYGGTVTGFNVGTGNGVGSSGDVTMIGRGWTITDCVDGLSAHNTSRIEGYDLAISACSKSAFQHINTTQSFHYRCSFTGKSGASAGIGQLDVGAINYSEDCDYIPIANNQSVSINGTYVRCRFGSMTVSATLGAQETVAGFTCTDCFINSAFDGRIAGTFTRCFGKLSMRIRGTLTNPDLTFTNCIFKAGASGGSNNALYGNLDSGTAWQGQGYIFRDCIFIGFTTGIGSGFTSTQYASFNGSSTIANCCFYSNTTNIHASITIATGTITSNPLIGTATTTAQSAWGFGSGSPCIGAGTSGNDIGFAA